MVYRCVKSNVSNDVIAIGRDEDQGGKDYNGIGVWADFTFNSIPELTEEVTKLILNHQDRENLPALLKVENDAVVLKTVEEINAEMEASNQVTEKVVTEEVVE